ncbi:hypothetical protein KC669_02485 [Candidatus Dojkabacteria bacterium]|uniref:Uncharacterized protein n=1 Tax=Candidatus Dojkabacteria bacterium TaxID=2099670 RepID=A0A955LB08_9BACT|nr:hypothetical protein [Candidatus Dojkabacteria bacterium]
MDTSELLSEGLKAGFGGGTSVGSPDRGSFILQSSHYELDGNIYHDEWVNGGGQELIRTSDGQAMTRTYVGNVISEVRLEELGITEKDVMKLLMKVIQEYAEHTRFDTDFEIQIEDWHYSYSVTYRKEDPFIINGIEEISYKNISVFVHTFGISKVIEE